MTIQEKLNLIKETGVIAILRAENSSRLLDASDAVRMGGITVIEVTMNTPGALDIIRHASTKYGNDILFGAGTVLDSETARAAIDAGADFIITPTLNVATIKLCNRYSIPVAAGCATPTEALTGWEAGADMIKLFPADIGGPELLRAILAPLPQLDIIPVGGVTIENAAEFIRKGAFALGVGNTLASKELLDKRDFAEITKRAEAFIAEVGKGREKG